MQDDAGYIMTVTCADTVGIVAAVSGFLATHDGFITESQQYADLETGRFFMRVAFRAAGPGCPPLDGLRAGFAAVAARFAMDWALVDAAARPRLLIAVSKLGHCLNDLLHRWRIGGLGVDITGVVSNHEDFRGLTEWHGLPFHHLPVTAATRAEQEAALLALAQGADYFVLARYMQQLSPALSAALAWRCINIHHSFLPSFKGARPYSQAHARGVKLIGATAHFVTAELDDGPIIEQDSARVHHGLTAADLVRVGRDTEAQVLARAVGWVAERRVLPNGARTVVFAR